MKILKTCIEKIFVLFISPSFSYYRFSESSVSQLLPRNFSVCIVAVLVFATYPNRFAGTDFWVLLKKSKLFFALYTGFSLFFILVLSNIYVLFPLETHAMVSYILSTVSAFMVSSRIYNRYLFAYIFSIAFIIISLFYEYNLFTTFEILYDYPANRIFMMCWGGDANLATPVGEQLKRTLCQARIQLRPGLPRPRTCGLALKLPVPIRQRHQDAALKP